MRFMSLTAITLAAFFAYGCLPESDASSTDLVSVSEIAKGTHSGVTTQRFEVMREASTFMDLWTLHAQPFVPMPPQPPIDFDQNMVVAVFLGTEPSGGYTIEITGVPESADSIAVNVRAVLPGSGCIVTAALTQPFHMVAIPRSVKPIAFVTTITRSDCA